MMHESQSPALSILPLSLALAGILGFLVCLALLVVPMATAAPSSTCSAGGALPAPLVATNVFTITGRVVDRITRPVECVQVFAFSGAIQHFTYTNSSGQFTLTLPRGTYDVVFNPPLGTHLASRSVRQIHDTSVLTIVLPAGHAIAGTVYRDAAHHVPVTNVAIFAFNTHTSMGFGLAPSGGDGSYQAMLETGFWKLTFTPPPFTGLGPTQTEELSLTADINLDILLPPGFTVHGQTVRMSSGGGVSDVEIFAKAPTEAEGYGFAPTDAGGVYTGTLPVGTFDILFLAPPFRGLGSTVVTNITGPPDVQRNVTLPAGYTVSGCGGPANSFVLAAPQPPLSAGSFSGWGRFTGADGFYALALQPGTYTFTVSPPGNVPGPSIPIIAVQHDVHLNFLCNFLPALQR